MTSVELRSVQKRKSSWIIQKKLCEESGLSYVEINKALYLADKELYTQLLQAIVGSKEQNKEAKTRDYLSLSEKHRSN